jgi:hypothetical protein
MWVSSSASMMEAAYSSPARRSRGAIQQGMRWASRAAQAASATSLSLDEWQMKTLWGVRCVGLGAGLITIAQAGAVRIGTLGGFGAGGGYECWVGVR